MKKCVYCASENRDEAIFCSRCRRPLQSRPQPPHIAYVWLLMVVFLIGLGSYLFASQESADPQMPTSTSPGMPAPTPVRQPATILVCVEDTTRIRRGPGTTYETTGGLPMGMCLTILGRNEDASWVYVVSDEDQTGWVSVTALPDIADLSRVSVRDDLAMVNPARPTLTSAEIANGARLYLTEIAATNDQHAPLSQYIEPCFEAVDRVGDQISCRVEKAYCDYLPDVEGSPTICIDKPAPDHTFALVVPDQDWSEYDGQCLIVEGVLEVDWGMLQIHALRRSQISACE